MLNKISFTTYAIIIILILLTGFLIVSKQSHNVVANDIIEIDNCNNPLDQAYSIYRLIDNITGDCIIAADNLVVDGQSLYTINGNILFNGPYSKASLENITINGFVEATNEFNEITISNSIINEYVSNINVQGPTEGIIVSDSHIKGYVVNISTTASSSGDTIISDSIIDGYVLISGDNGNSGGIDISGSSIAQDVIVEADHIRGFISVSNSNIEGDIINRRLSIDNSSQGSSNIDIVDSDIFGDIITDDTNFFAISITIENSHIRGDVAHTDLSNKNIALKDSIMEGNVTGHNLNLIDTPPILEIVPLTDLEITYDEIFDDTVDISASDQVGRDIVDLTDQVQITGEVGEDPGEYILEYSVTDSGTTITFNGTPTTAGPNTTTLTRIITRLAEDVPPPSQQPRRRSGSSGGSTFSQTPTIILSQTLPSTLEGLYALLTQMQAQLMQLMSQNVFFTRNLDIHATGPDVTALQQLLISQGYNILEGPTGYFGFQTWAALRQYQQDNNLPATGWFGPLTRAHINKK